MFRSVPFFFLARKNETYANVTLFSNHFLPRIIMIRNLIWNFAYIDQRRK